MAFEKPEDSVLNSPLAVDTLCATVHRMALDKGWWDTEEDTFLNKLILVHSEISEAVEEFRSGHALEEIYYAENGKPEGIPIELADAVIRIADLAQRYKIDLLYALNLKIAYNATRPQRHGGKRV